jgi:hypothetical protein
MQIMIECPDVLFSELSVPAALSGIGARLEAVEDEPAGPWLGVFLASIDITKLTEWDLPAYLRATAKHQAWAASLTVEAVGELASRPGEFGSEKEIAFALREPVGAATQRIWVARRLRRLPITRQLFRAGEVSEKHAAAMVAATSSVQDAGLLAEVEDKVFTRDGALAKTATELKRTAKQVLQRFDPAGAQDRARAARDDADVFLQPGEDGMGPRQVTLARGSAKSAEPNRSGDPAFG